MGVAYTTTTMLEFMCLSLWFFMDARERNIDRRSLVREFRKFWCQLA